MKIFRLSLFLCLIFNFAFANVRLDIPNEVVKDEAFIFTVNIEGSDIKLPDLSQINGNALQKISSSSSRTIINSQLKSSIKQSYAFYPLNDFIFPSLEFEVDGKKYLSKEKKIKVVNPSKTKSDLFDLSIKINKEEVYVGEEFILTIVFKYKKDTQILDLNLIQPNFKDFWSKSLNDLKQYNENDFRVQEIKYLLMPLKSGSLNINPISIHTQIMDPRKNSFSFFSNGVSSFKLYSNALKLNIKPLPNNINLIGNFNIKAKLDKTKIKENEAVSFNIFIDGHGNIDDLEDIKLNIKDATIYENKPVIKSEYKNGKNSVSYNKAFSIISNKSFEIHQITLSYFDKEKKQVMKKQTKSFFIEVSKKQNSFENEQLQKKHIDTKEISKKHIVKVVERSSLKHNILFFILGSFTSVLILGLYFYVKKIKEEKKFNDKPLIKKIKKTKTKDELLKILGVYIKQDAKLDELIFKIEKNEDISSLKKELMKVLKEIKLKGKSL